MAKKKPSSPAEPAVKIAARLAAIEYLVARLLAVTTSRMSETERQDLLEDCQDDLEAETFPDLDVAQSVLDAEALQDALKRLLAMAERYRAADHAEEDDE